MAVPHPLIQTVIPKQVLMMSVCLVEPGGAVSPSILLKIDMNLSSEAIQNGIEDDQSRLGKKFQRHFRVPNIIFLEICRDIDRVNGEHDGINRACSEMIPVSLLVLTSLRVLGSGCTFEAVEGLTAVSECTHHKLRSKK